MLPQLQEKKIRLIFIFSLILKGFNSLLEIALGLLLLLTTKITGIISYLISSELIEDPTDFVATHIRSLLPYFSTHSELFGAFYLLSHGIVKIFLVVCLLRNKLWAYPATIAVLFLFIVYQVYRLSYNFSLTLILLTLFDIFVVYLTWHEYNTMKRHYRFS